MNLGCISRWNGRRGTKLRKASGVPFPLGRKNFSAILKRIRPAVLAQVLRVNPMP
jgi:hypothetical protein